MHALSFRTRLAGATLATAIGLGAVGLVPGQPAAADAGLAAPLAECTTTFLGAAGDARWEEPLNWSEQEVPTHEDVACMDQIVDVASETSVLQVRGTGGVQIQEGAHLRVLGDSDAARIQVFGGRLEVGGDWFTGSFTQWGGTVAGDGWLFVDEAFSWSGGLQEGAGSTVVSDLAQADLWAENGNIWGGRALSMGGTVRVQGAGGIDFQDAPVALGRLVASGELISLFGTGITVALGAEVAADLVLPEGFNVQGPWAVAAGGELTLERAGIAGEITLAEGSFLSIDGFDDTTPERSETTLYRSGRITGDGELVIVDDASLHVPSGSFMDPGLVTVDGALAVGGLMGTDRLTIREGGEVELAPGTTTNAHAFHMEDGRMWLPEGATFLTVPGDAVMDDGLLELGGTFGGGLRQNGGTVEVGALAIVDGDYTQAGGTFRSVTENQHPGSLTVHGTATLGGAFELDAPAGVVVQGVVVAAVSQTGEFTEVIATSQCPGLFYIAGTASVEVASSPCLFVDDTVVAEDDGLAAIAVRITEALAEPLTFTYETGEHGSALGDEDFVPVEGSATIAPGETVAVVEVEILDDDEVEDDETFFFGVNGPGGVHQPDGFINATIVDDDDAVAFGDSYRIDAIGSERLAVVGGNATHLVGHYSPDADTTFSWAMKLADFVTGPVPGMENTSVHDINESGQIISGHQIRNRGQAVPTPLARPAGWSTMYAEALNDAGVVVGFVNNPSPDISQFGAYGIVRWTDPASPEVLTIPADYLTVEDINSDGDILGNFKTDIATPHRPYIYDAETGFRALPALPGFEDEITVAWAINDSGVVVGRSGSHAVRWEADGTPVDLGTGQAIDIDERGVIVGTDTEEDGFGADPVLWADDVRYRLQDLVPGAEGWDLNGIELLTDEGLIVGSGSFQGELWTFLLQPYECYVCVTTTFEERSVRTGEHAPFLGATTEGNDVRMRTRLDNPTLLPADVVVRVRDGLTGEELLEEPLEVTVAPGGRQSIDVDIDTDGMAWSNGAAAGPRTFQVVVHDAETGRLLTEEISPLLVDPRPVVLVHGLWSDASTWQHYPLFAEIAHERLETFAVGTLDTSTGATSVATNAERVAAYIDQVRFQTGAWSVDVVGHSMGGLISRRYIHALMPTYDREGEVRPIVRNLVMLGTPNAGSPCAWLAQLPATFELRPEVVALFNAENTERRGVQFSVGVGEHLPFTCTSPLPGDDVVPEISATQGMEDTAFFDGMAHTSMTGSRDMFDQFVLPRLNGTAIPAAAAAPAERSGFASAAVDPAVAADDEMPTTFDQQLMWLDELELAPGDAYSVAMVVPAVATDVAVVLTGPGTLAAELVDERGRVVATAAADPAATQPTFRTLWAPATTGRWTLRTSNPTDATVAASVGVVAVGAPVTLSATAEQVHWSGRVGITVDYEAPAGTRAPIALAGELRHADGSTTFEVRDDGLGSDVAAGDGRYATVVRDVPNGPAAATVTVFSPSGTLTATAATSVVIDEDRADNAAPVASDLAVDVPGGGNATVTLPATDADGDDLGYTVGDGPDHGSLGGDLPTVTYVPQRGFRGTDTVTFTVTDGVATSVPATVTFTVGDPEADVRYGGPFPSTAAQGQTVQLSAYVYDEEGRGVQGVEVTFDLAGQVATGTTSIGGNTAVDLTIAAIPGEHELVITTAAAGGLAAGRQTRSFTVLVNRTPAPFIGAMFGDEAGYPVRFVADLGDLDGDAVSAEWDFDGDGTTDLVGGTFDRPLGRVYVEHTYPAAYAGPVTVTIEDALGQRGSDSYDVVVEPHRPLGSMRRILTPDGASIDPLDWDRSGRYILGSTPIPGSSNPVRDHLVVLDRQTGELEVASVGTDGSLREAEVGAISPDGRFVAFRGLDAGSSRAQVLLRDLEAGTTTLVSATADGRPGNDASNPLAVAIDGSAVLFSSDATNLGATCPGCSYQYRWERATGDIEVVSLGLDGEPVPADRAGGSMSADGSVVAFETKIPGPAPIQVLVVDVEAGTVELASVAAGGGPGGDHSQRPQLDDDGSVVVFSSDADDLVAGGQASSFAHVFVRDLSTDTTRAITSAGAPTDGGSHSPSVSGDGRRVVFASGATTLVPGDTNRETDVFVADVATGAISRVSRDPRDGEEADSGSLLLGSGRFLTCDGASVLFQSGATNLVPGDVALDFDTFVDGPIVTCPALGAGGGGEEEPDEEEEVPPTTPTTPTTEAPTPTTEAPTPTTEAPTPTTEAPTPTTEDPVPPAPTVPDGQPAPATPAADQPVVAAGDVPAPAPSTTAAPAVAEVLGSDLARTGGGTGGLRAGALLVAAGIALVLAGRRRRREA